MLTVTKPTVRIDAFVPLEITKDLKHVSYTFYLSDISRCVLQELARHREASLSVKSTRYTLKELKNEKPFLDLDFNPSVIDIVNIVWEGRVDYELLKRVNKYIVLTNNVFVDASSILALVNLKQLIEMNIGNDIAKYALPECYKTELTWTVNGDGLKNFLRLRTDKAALWEIRLLAYEIYNQLPEDHKYLYEDIIYKDEIKVDNKGSYVNKKVLSGLVHSNELRHKVELYLIRSSKLKQGENDLNLVNLVNKLSIKLQPLKEDKNEEGVST